MIQASHSTLSDAALALKASARAGQSMPDLRGWTEISWSNEGIEYWRRGDRLFLPPSEKGASGKNCCRLVGASRRVRRRTSGESRRCLLSPSVVAASANAHLMGAHGIRGSGKAALLDQNPQRSC